MQHVNEKCDMFVVDLETEGVGDRAKILQIAVVAFDSKEPITAKDPERAAITWNCDICDLLVQDVQDAVSDAATLEWWHEPERLSYYNHLKSAEVFHMEHALGLLTEFIKTRAADKFYLVGNGVDFDNRILANAYKRYGLEKPWTYKNDFCYRTVNALLPLQETVSENWIKAVTLEARQYFPSYDQDYWQPHNAAYDAMYEALTLNSKLLELGKRYE